MEMIPACYEVYKKIYDAHLQHFDYLEKHCIPSK